MAGISGAYASRPVASSAMHDNLANARGPKSGFRSGLQSRCPGLTFNQRHQIYNRINPFILAPKKLGPV